MKERRKKKRKEGKKEERKKKRRKKKEGKRMRKKGKNCKARRKAISVVFSLSEETGRKTGIIYTILWQKLTPPKTLLPTSAVIKELSPIPAGAD